MADRTVRPGAALRALLTGIGSAGAFALSAEAVAIDPTSSTVGWVPIAYPSLQPDYFDDERTGIPEADIIGNSSNPAFYYRFDDAGTPSTTDGNLGFRVRVGADKNPAGFDHFMGVGIDANADGALDLFLAVDNSGNPDRIGIFDAGTGANTSPSTTSINSTPLFSYALSVTNYNFAPVTAISDPSATGFDLDGDGNTDQLLTWVIPFADIVSALAAQGIGGITEASPVRFVVGSSTQANALNQDLGGPGVGATTSTSTWAALGALSNLLPIPEPDTGALLSLGLCALAARARARRRALRG